MENTLDLFAYRCPLCGAYSAKAPQERKIRPIRKCSACKKIVKMEVAERTAACSAPPKGAHHERI